MALRAGHIGPFYAACPPDPKVLDFVWHVGEVAAAGGDPRDLLFGPNASVA